jgi:hypothetical protein
MSTIEERIAAVEARLDTLTDLRALVVELRDDMHRRFDAVDRRFEAMDRRFEAVDRRFAGVDTRFGTMDHRIEQLIGRGDRHFRWLVGIQMSVATTMIATLLTLAVL